MTAPAIAAARARQASNNNGDDKEDEDNVDIWAHIVQQYRQQSQQHTQALIRTCSLCFGIHDPYLGRHPIPSHSTAPLLCTYSGRSPERAGLRDGSGGRELRPRR